MTLRETGQPRGTAELAGVLLHGRGKTPHEKIDLALRLDAPGFRWVVPEAPGGSWYPKRFMEPVESNQPWLSEALVSTEAALREASEDGRIGPERLAIVGFSQGACLATEYILQHGMCCGAVVIFTGAIIGVRAEHWRRHGPRLDGLRALVTGSDIDDWVDDAHVRETADVLASLGAEVRLRIYEGRPHIVSPEELLEAQTMLQEMREDMSANY